MADGFLRWVAGIESEFKSQAKGYAIAPAVVTNNLDFIAEGRVQVRISTLPAFEPWARLTAIGGGSSRGFLWVPQIDDEVLVAFNQDDERDAFILGGLWNMLDRPPLTIPTDFLIKRVIKTGLTNLTGHEIEFDDAMQSITITTSGLTPLERKRIIMDPSKIELSNLAGTMSIKMDSAAQSISITAPFQIELNATQIKIEGVQVELKGANINIQATGPCSVQGLPVKIN